MFAPLQERWAAASRALVLLGAACLLSGLVAWCFYEHAPASIHAPSLALYVPLPGFPPAAVPMPPKAHVAWQRIPVVSATPTMMAAADDDDGKHIAEEKATVASGSIAQVAGASRRAVLSGAAAAALSPLVAQADTVVDARKVGVTPGGVKYFTKVADTTCSPFNPCSPQKGDIVKLKYKSFLSNGQMYDSSEGPGRKPLAAKYGGGQMLPGWEEALDGMQMGQTRVIQVPPKMAYGEKGLSITTKDGGSEFLVPPNATLQFELTLVQVSLPPP